MQVVELADRMIAGISEHPEKFPSCDTAGLQALREEFMQASVNLNDAEAQATIAAEDKLRKFKKLQTEIKRQVKYGTADSSNNPEEVVLMGWGIRRDPQQIEMPGPPGSLKITAQSAEGRVGDNGMLCLVWDKSRRGGGPVRSYIIERKQFTGGDWSQWQFAGNSYNNEIKLTKQPPHTFLRPPLMRGYESRRGGFAIGVKLWYQVRAGNASGVSCPSNMVAVVL